MSGTGIAWRGCRSRVPAWWGQPGRCQCQNSSGWRHSLRPGSGPGHHVQWRNQVHKASWQYYWDYISSNSESEYVMRFNTVSAQFKRQVVRQDRLNRQYHAWTLLVCQLTIKAAGVTRRPGSRQSSTKPMALALPLCLVVVTVSLNSMTWTSVYRKFCEKRLLYDATGTAQVSLLWRWLDWPGSPNKALWLDWISDRQSIRTRRPTQESWQDWPSGTELIIMVANPNSSDPTVTDSVTWALLSKRLSKLGNLKTKLWYQSLLTSIFTDFTRGSAQQQRSRCIPDQAWH